MSSHAPVAKKLKPTGTPLYSELDLSKLTIDAKPQGSNEIQHASVKYDGLRLAFQFEDVNTGSLRVPFGIDDGSKFSGKPSLKLELPKDQCAFMQDTLENLVKEAAVENKATWFSAINPPPDDATIRSSFNSRIHQDDNGNFPPSLKVNIKPQTLNVLTTRRMIDGKITKPTEGGPGDVVRGCSVVPVLRTAGGVWITVNPKKKTMDYGIILEATDLMVIEEPATSSAFNLGGVEVAEEETVENGGVTTFGGAFGQFDG
jgi:hypothetical protein